MQIKRGEIYYADLRPIIGSEQGGVRPVLVLQNDIGNRHSPTTIVAAITSSRTKARLPTHVRIYAKGLRATSIVLLEQIRTVDKRRLKEYIGRLDEVAMARVDSALALSLGVSCEEVLLNDRQERCEQQCVLL